MGGPPDTDMPDGDVSEEELPKTARHLRRRRWTNTSAQGTLCSGCGAGLASSQEGLASNTGGCPTMQRRRSQRC
eukprot:5778057-Amphidinium_carterae.1